MPQHILTKAHERAATAGVYAELYRLREEVKGPDGFDTWKDAAIAERKARVELEKAVPILSDIDYLGAMAAFNSDEWHKMGPITGYMHGWNACRAAMLQAGNYPVTPDGWVMVPKEMTDAIGEAIAMHANCCGGIALDIYDAMLAAAPQQEVKSALEHGMQRYAGAMQKLSEGDK
ncbi:hypothetical protein ABL623_000158 [Salmonella enterica subsp. enterica serovar Newport]